jgi:hypothetical protein
MNRALLLSASSLAALLAGCSVFGSSIDLSEPAVVAPAALTDVTAIQRTPFKVGESSHTVEKLAKAQACTSTQGAGLVTEPGPIEVYRMQCQNGQVFMARCELRQCKKM